MNLKEIEARLAAIAREIEEEGADIDALDEEARGLIAQKQQLAAKAEKRQKLIRDVMEQGQVVRSFGGEAEERQSYGVDSREYRSLWLRHLQGEPLNEMEQRAYTAANGAISTMTANAIMEVVRDHAPLLERITVIRSAESITYYMEGDSDEAQDHTENEEITPSSDGLIKISLVPAEIVKLIQISAAAKAMSVDAFESWLVKSLGEAIARKINKKIITALMASASSAGTEITTATVQALLGSVKGQGVAVLCNRKTLYTKLLPLQDDSKSSIVRFAGGTATVYGVEVMLDDNMTDDTVAAGDLEKIAAALAEDVTVRQDYDIDTNSTKYLGVALFDVKVGQAKAFAKLAAA